MSEKLQKILAATGLGSRRQMEQWIEAGRISVNGDLAKLGDRAEQNAIIKVDGQLIKNLPKTQALPSVLIYHKPEGEMCTRADPEGRNTVFDKLPSLTSGRWVIVGRLDFNTSGLLLFTNNGELANKLMHPKFHLTRVYAVRIFGTINSTVLTKLQQGVELEDGMAHFDIIESMGGERSNHWYRVSVAMGRNRIVRRLWESQGVKVSRLIRLCYGPIALPRTLTPGKFAFLSTKEVQQLMTVLK